MMTTTNMLVLIPGAHPSFLQVPMALETGHGVMNLEATPYTDAPLVAQRAVESDSPAETAGLKTPHSGRWRD